MAEPIMVCARCGAVPPKPPTSARPPRGWKRVSTEAIWCATCTRDGYQIRAVTVPIASVQDGTWQEIGAAAKTAWAETTACANWIATTLYARDVRREPVDAKLRPMPAVYLYPEARERFPGIAPINLTALIQQIEQTYRRRRYELLWQASISLPTYRYPVPAPIHQQAWTLEEPTRGCLVARVRLGERWWALRLTGWSARHLADLRAIVSGAALPAAGALLSVPRRGSDHRGGVSSRRLMLKLVARFPRVPAASGDRILRVETRASHLLALTFPDGRDPLLIAADDLRRRIAGWEVQRARWTQQLQVVRRWVPAEREALRERLARGAERQHHAVRTQLQQLAALVAGQADRARVASVVYEDEERGFQPVFPWVGLRCTLQQAIERRGMTWTYASGETGTEEPEALAETAS